MIFRRMSVLAAAVAMVLPVVASGSPAAARTASGPPRVLQSAEIARQDIAARLGSEPDTVVEPHIAVSPQQPHTAVAAYHDSRFFNGGAVDIGYAWTRNGGGSWHHAPVPGLTTAVGGSYQRASDPVVQFAADGTAYLSTLLFDITTCRSAVAVSRSTDGGATWGLPVLAHASTDCNYSDDKNWLVIDNSPTSPHFGRIYQFWSVFLSSDGGVTFTSSPQVVRFSDDRAATWSQTFMINPLTANTQDSQPMILADGTIVDTYQDYGPSKVSHDSERGHRRPGGIKRADGIAPTIEMDAIRSTDGGMTWGSETTVTNGVGFGPPDVRCCLPGANIDHATGRMYAVWESAGPSGTDPVQLSSSTDGIVWTPAQTISQTDGPGVGQVSVAVTADHGQVFVSYGTRTDAANNGGFVQQELSYSSDGGATFAGPLALGPPSALKWAAEVDPGGCPDTSVTICYFPGDYIGAAASDNFLYLDWALSSQPPAPTTFHQVLWANVLRY